MNKRTLFSFTHAAMRRHRAVSVAVCLFACPVAASAAKPVTIYASRYQRGWAGEDKAEWISAPTTAERAFFPDERVLGVYRAGEEAPYGKAVIIHRENPWDDVRDPGLFIILR